MHRNKMPIIYMEKLKIFSELYLAINYNYITSECVSRKNMTYV